MNCPLCQCVDNYSCKKLGRTHDMIVFDCEVCGRFNLPEEVMEDYFSPGDQRLTPVTRGYLSFFTRQPRPAGQPVPRVTPTTIEEAIAGNRQLPSPSQQARNALRIIGEMVLATGRPLDHLPKDFRAQIGAINQLFADQIVKELVGKGLLFGTAVSTTQRPSRVCAITPTLAGWDAIENERKGRISGNYGFIALKFGDEILDPFVTETVKPAVKSIGYELVDLRDTAKAGVIDNVLREQIRDAAFVLVDLTHANNGAYWEAGFAEGLGKPVLYLCERSVFSERGTHFDTNHCTTIMWSAEEKDKFTAELIATLRRSLGLFE
ncbi:MAG: hypothetical protein RLZZ09_701 [Pseudomonadota bacterium]